MPERDRTLTIFASLFGLLAVSNLLKPLQLGGAQTGFVFFGERLTGTANAVAGPIFGLFLLAYAGAIWTRKRIAVPMSHAYALYVFLNLVMFTMRTETPGGIGYAIFGIVYSIVALGVSVGAAITLTRRKAELG